MERLKAAMRKAEAAVLEQEGVEVSLIVKDFFNGPVEAVLQRMAGPGGRRGGGWPFPGPPIKKYFRKSQA